MPGLAAIVLRLRLRRSGACSPVGPADCLPPSSPGLTGTRPFRAAGPHSGPRRQAGRRGRLSRTPAPRASPRPTGPSAWMWMIPPSPITECCLNSTSTRGRLKYVGVQPRHFATTESPRTVAAASITSGKLAPLTRSVSFPPRSALSCHRGARCGVASLGGTRQGTEQVWAFTRGRIYRTARCAFGGCWYHRRRCS